MSRTTSIRKTDTPAARDLVEQIDAIGLKIETLKKNIDSKVLQQQNLEDSRLRRCQAELQKSIIYRLRAFIDRRKLPKSVIAPILTFAVFGLCFLTADVLSQNKGISLIYASVLGFTFFWIFYYISYGWNSSTALEKRCSARSRIDKSNIIAQDIEQSKQALSSAQLQLSYLKSELHNERNHIEEQHKKKQDLIHQQEETQEQQDLQQLFVREFRIQQQKIRQEHNLEPQSEHDEQIQQHDMRSRIYQQERKRIQKQKACIRQQPKNKDRNQQEEQIPSREEQLKQLYESNWKDLRGIPFEEFIGEIFTAMDYEVELTKVSGDQGVDLIATKNKIRIAIQVKGSSNPIGNTAVQEVNAGMSFYDCHSCIAITNNRFTPGATLLAEKIGCTLIDETNFRDFVFGRLLD